MKRNLSTLILMLSVALPLRAQFYSEGNESALVPHWQITTPNYRVIFPEGLDSLARLYAEKLEEVRIPVGGSCGYLPNEKYLRRMPVVLFPRMVQSNGSVTWTPRRMELFTTPDYLAPYSEPWIDGLCTHESRHLSQMQFSNDSYFRVFHTIAGQISDAAFSAIYPGRAIFEGDAVVAETALGKAGRGRDADFLEYIRVCFREGDYRDFWSWRYTSLKRFSTTDYEAGYLLMGGVRAIYGAPDFTSHYFRRLMSNFLPAANLQKSVKDVSGVSLKEAFRRVGETLAEDWNLQAERGRPWTRTQRITADTKYYLDLKPVGIFDGKTYVFGSGISDTPALYSVEEGGSLSRVASLSYSTSELRICPADGKIYFSEIVPDLRWERRSYSVICTIDTAGHYRTLTSGTRYFNPAPSPDGKHLAAVEYAENGEYFVVVLRPDGSMESRIPSPQGFQPVECEWNGAELVVSAISSDGAGIYSVGDVWKTLLEPVSFKIKQLVSDGRGELYFTGDGSGANELYVLRDGKARMLTSSPCGLSAFRFSPVEETLLCSELDPRGRHIVSINAGELRERRNFTSDPYPLATALSAGEKVAPEEKAVVGPTEKYSRLRHLLNVHSWAPCYVDYDAVSDLSVENVFSSAGLGATVFLQNELSTFSSIASWHIEPSNGCRNSGHMKMTYTGLFPVFEFSGSVNERNATRSDAVPTREYEGNRIKSYTSIHRTEREGALWQGTIKTYIPFNFNSRGLSRGVIPQFSATLSNDLFDYDPQGRYTVSLRGYIMDYIPSSCIFPRFGIGGEIGWTSHFLQDIRPQCYGSLYAYLPGFHKTHGIKLTAFHTQSLGDAVFSENVFRVVPRGWSEGLVSTASYPSQSKFTAEYVFPFCALDWSGLGPFAFVRNLEGGVHFDACMYSSPKMSAASLFSAGASLSVRLENLAFAPFPTRIGLSWSRNFGFSDSDFSTSLSGWGRNYFGLVFSMDI